MRWLNTNGFCSVLVAIVLMLAVRMFAAAGHVEEGDLGRPVTVTGQLVDVSFIVTDGQAGGADHTERAAACLAAGLPAAILPDGASDPDELLYLLTNPTALVSCAGKTIKVEGMQIDHKHAIDVNRVWVKDGPQWSEVQLKDDPNRLRAAGAVAATAGGAETDQTDQWQVPARAARTSNPVARDTQSLAFGKAVYTGQCLACHGVAGRGDGPTALTLMKRPPDFTNPRLWEQSDGSLFWKISEGHRPMPTWRPLVSESDRWNVVNYLRTFAPRPGETPAPTTQP
jgi:mono/diheme cytochrome c family protein